MADPNVAAVAMAAANILTALPPEKANLSKFPPSCSVLLLSDPEKASDDDAAKPPSDPTEGRVLRVFVDLFSSNREDQHVVEVKKQGSLQTQEIVAEEATLRFGPGCPVTLKFDKQLGGLKVPGCDNAATVEGTVTATYQADIPTAHGAADNGGEKWMWDLSFDYDDEYCVTAKFFPPEGCIQPGVLHPTWRGGKVKAKRWWYVDERTAKNAVFMRFLQACVDNAILEDLRHLRNGRKLF